MFSCCLKRLHGSKKCENNFYLKEKRLLQKLYLSAKCQQNNLQSPEQLMVNTAGNTQAASSCENLKKIIAGIKKRKILTERLIHLKNIRN